MILSEKQKQQIEIMATQAAIQELFEEVVLKRKAEILQEVRNSPQEQTPEEIETKYVGQYRQKVGILVPQPPGILKPI